MEISSFLVQSIPLIGIFLTFYFILIRPKQKEIRQHKALIEQLRVGDTVVLSSGIYGTIKTIEKDTNIQLEVSSGVIITVVKAQVISKTNISLPQLKNTVSKSKTTKKSTSKTTSSKSKTTSTKASKSKSNDSSNSTDK